MQGPKETSRQSGLGRMASAFDRRAPRKPRPGGRGGFTLDKVSVRPNPAHDVRTAAPEMSTAVWKLSH